MYWLLEASMSTEVIACHVNGPHVGRILSPFCDRVTVINYKTYFKFDKFIQATRLEMANETALCARMSNIHICRLFYLNVYKCVCIYMLRHILYTLCG